MIRSTRALRVALLAIAAGTAATDVSAAAPLPPRPTRYATDLAGTFAPARLSALNDRLAAFERETSNQVLVYVDRRVPAGTTLEQMSTAAVRAWGVGQKDKRNGVVLFVFVDDRKMRIEVGYGLEGALPDAAAHRITDGVIKPHFRKGDYAAGVEAGAAAILARLRTEGLRGTGVTAAEKARGVQPGNARPGVVQPRVPIPAHRRASAGAAAQSAPLSFRWLWPLIALAPLLAWPLVRSLVRAVAWGALLGSIACFTAAVASLQVAWAVFGVVLALVSGFAFLLWRVQQPGWTPPVRDTAVASGDDSWSWSSGSSDSSASSSSSDSGSSSGDFSGGGGDSGGGGSSDSW